MASANVHDGPMAEKLIQGDETPGRQEGDGNFFYFFPP
jgi:hypothetical protein